MAHYIAGLITESKKANAKDKRLIQEKCFDTILALWQHRNVMPDGKRPFEDLESIVRIIGSLNPDKKTIHYSHSVRSSIVSDEESDETKTLFKIIEDIDYSARVMIVDCLAHASRSAIDKSKEWVKLAETAEISHAPAEMIIQFISSDGKQVGTHHNMREKLKRFENFIEIANTFAANMRQQINELSDESEKANTSKILRKKKRTTEKEKTAKKRFIAKKKARSKKKVSSKKMSHGKRRTLVAKRENTTKKNAITKKKSPRTKRITAN